jgi:hypothetical protein
LDGSSFAAPAQSASQPIAAQPVIPEPAPSQTAALVAWQEQKNVELREKDAGESEANDALRATAGQSARDFLTTISASQEKRAVHNRELDEQKKADLNATGNTWEKVVKFIDFNRSDLHERDVSKMKTLLLQLKH